MEGNKDVKRYKEAQSWALPLSSRAARVGVVQLATPEPKAPADLGPGCNVAGVCQLHDGRPLCWGGETLSYFFLCLFKSHYPEKHLEKRHCLFPKKSWERVMDWRSLLSHTSQSRLPPSPNNVLKKSKVVSDFYFFLHPCGLGRGNQEFWGGGYFRDSWENESTTSIPTERATVWKVCCICTTSHTQTLWKENQDNERSHRNKSDTSKREKPLT